MVGLNLIALFSPDLQSVLMCRRRKEPYLGLLNFVGGHIEPDEDGRTAAYRELYEETAVTEESVKLIHLMDFSYPLSDCYVEVYFGRLRQSVDVHGDENKLLWCPVDWQKDGCGGFDMREYAGEGNIGHIMEQIKINRRALEE